MTAILDGQAELRAGDANALVIGDGTSYIWSESGPTWWSAPAVRSSDQDRANSDGSTPGRDLLGNHATTIIVTMLGDSESDVGDLIDAWKAACAVSPDELVAVRINVLGRTRVRYGRFRIPGEADAALARKGYVAIGSCQFETFDGRTYGDDLHVVSTGRTLPGSGVTLPVTLPMTLGASVSGVVVATNAGNRTASWTARLDGPIGYPAITHLETGRRLSLALTANGGVDISGGQWVTLDSATRSVLLNDTADRRMNLTVDSDWWELDPGANTYQLDAATGEGTLQIAWRDAYRS